MLQTEPERVYQIPDGRGGMRECSWDELNRFRWTTGIGLEELLDPLQLELDVTMDALPPITSLFVLEARKIGKSYGALSRANKVGRRKRNSVIRFAFPTAKQGKSVIIPLLEEVQETCPSELKWKWRQAEDCWYLEHRNSRLYLAGTDDAGQMDLLRGPRSDLTILDEVTYFHCNLPALMRVLRPQLLNTGGNIIFTGTAPESLDHGSLEYYEIAKRKGRLVVKTIFDNPRLSLERIRLICEEANPKASPADIDLLMRFRARPDRPLLGTPEWRREYLCEMISDDNLRVVPAFNHERHVRKLGVPHYADKYVFIDTGYAKDFFAAVFCALDYASQKLLVVAELVLVREPTDKILRDLRAIETRLEWDRLRGNERLKRYMESNPQQIRDFKEKGYTVLSAPQSPGKGKVVVELENRLNADDVLVDESCTQTIDQLTNGVWADTAKQDFRRSPKLGHLDALDALATGIRQVDWRHNPAPRGVYQSPDTVIELEELERRRSKNKNALERVFGVRGRSIVRAR